MRDKEIEQDAVQPVPLDLPDEFGEDETEDDGANAGSLTDDIFALFDDGRTYVEAELQYQKTRASFAASRGKHVVVYGVVAFGVLHMALIALTVGVVLTLAPILGALAATAIVVVSLVVIGVVFLSMLKSKLGDIRDAFAEGEE